MKGICNSVLGEAIQSSSNIIFIQLNSYTITKYAFKLRWQKIPNPSQIPASEINDPKCGNNSQYIIINHYNIQEFSSPGFPNGYENYLNCSWIVTTNLTTYHPNFRLSYLDLENDQECLSHYVEIFQSSNMIEWISLGRYCSPPLPTRSFAGTPFLKINFITNWASNRTGFRGDLKAECGNTLTQPSGVIKHINVANRIFGISTNQSCTWVIKLRPGKMIEFMFEDINIDCSSPSSGLIIRNGGDVTSPFLGNKRYCGTSGNDIDIPITSSNTAVVVIGYVYNAATFTLAYQEKGIDCSHQIILSELRPNVIITSPNFPNKPDPHSECTWIISTSFGENIKYELISNTGFDISNCNNEYIEIYSAKSSIGNKIKQYCGHKRGNFHGIADSDVITIKYKVSLDNPNAVFKLNISISECGKVLTARNGVISSPEHNRNYIGNLTCTYHIVGDRRFGVLLGFGDISLSDGDSINVYSYSHDIEKLEISNYKLMATLTGNITEDNIIIPDDQVIIEFNSLNYNSGKAHWEIHYIIQVYSTCRENYETNEGYITSPGYPVAGQMKQKCFYKIKVPPGRRIKIDFLDIDFSPISSQNALASHILFYDENTLFETIYANYTHKEFYSTANFLSITYVSREVSQHRGFKLHFSSDSPTSCSGNLDELSGTIEVLTNMTGYLCTYQRSPDSLPFPNDPKSGTMAMHFHGAKESNGTFVDYTNDIKLNINQPHLSTIRIPLPTIKVIFKHDKRESLVNINPKMNYTVHKCGGRIILDYGHRISLPKMDKDKYGVIDCAWLVETNSDNMILINITMLKFALRQEQEYIRLYHGPSIIDTQLETYHKDNIKLHSMVSRSNKLFIEYHSDLYSNDTNFSIYLETTSDTCGGILTDNKYLKSPIVSDVLKKYPHNTECVWEIVTTQGYHIVLKFIDRFYLEESHNCTKDFVEIYDWVNNNWKTMGRVCGRQQSKIFNSTSTRMKVSL